MIKTTTNYDMFSMMEQNRDVDLNNRKTKNLVDSMIEYGWLSAFPLMAKKERNRLVVIDGQHRLQISREYGIPVKYVVETQNIDVARLNDTAKSWTPIDFAKKWTKAGKEDYIELLEFFYANPISLTMCAAILANTTHFSNCSDKFYQGTYRIKNRKAAYGIAECYSALVGCSAQLKKNGSIKALWACYHVDHFDPKRLIEGATKRAASIKGRPNTEGYLELFEELYNFGRKTQHPLRFDAQQAMKSRSAA